jgi:hypothetical protein
VQNRKNKPRIGLVPSAASKIFAMLIEHETKTIFEKRKRTLGMRSRPQLYRAVFAGGGGGGIPRFGGNCRRITDLNWQFSATGGGSPHLSYF